MVFIERWSLDTGGLLCSGMLFITVKRNDRVQLESKCHVTAPVHNVTT